MRAKSVAAAVLAFALAVLPVISHAEENRSGLVWMSADEITATFKGEVLAGLYPSNTPSSRSTPTARRTTGKA